MGIAEQLNKLKEQGLFAILSAAGGLVFLLAVFYLLLGPLGAVLAALSGVPLPYLLIMAGALVCLFFGCLAYHKASCESKTCAAEEKAQAAETQQKQTEDLLTQREGESNEAQEKLERKKEKVKRKKLKLEEKEKKLEENEIALKNKESELTNKEKELETREDEIIRMQNGGGTAPPSATTSSVANTVPTPGNRSNRN